MASAVVRPVNDECRVAAFTREEVLNEAQQVVVERELRSAARAWATNGKQTSVGEPPDRLQTLLEYLKARPAPCSTTFQDVDELPVAILPESKFARCVGVLCRLHGQPRLGVKLEVRRHTVLAKQPMTK